MVAGTDSYSRLVAWLKILLPLLALSILSTMFLVSRTIDPAQTIPYAKVDVDELARTQRMSAPSYSSVTHDGSSVSFRATSARPDLTTSGVYIANEPVARIERPGGQVIDIRSKGGVLDQTADIVTMTGDVNMDTSDGYHLQTEKGIAQLDGSRFETEAHVSSQGPFGTLEAGRGIMTTDDKGAVALRFENGVHLVYRPAE